MVPKIMGNKFLGKLLEDEVFFQKLTENKSCEYSPPGILSVPGLLDKTGIFKIRTVTEQQKADEKIDVSASNFIELFDKLNSYNT